MTVDYDPDNSWQEDQEPDDEGPEPIPVKVISTESQRVAPEFTSCNTFAVPQSGSGLGANGRSDVQILNRNYHRYKAKIQVQPTEGVTAIVTNTSPDPLNMPNPVGASFLVPVSGSPFNLPEYDGMQPLYVTAIGGTALVAIWDETYGVVQ